MTKREEQGRVTRDRLLAAAVKVIREKGYAAARVEDFCAEAGATKGAFFHHFSSKEDMACQAASFFGEMAEGLFGSAPYQSLDDPVEKLLGYVAFRRSLLQGEAWSYTCLLGTIAQEVHGTIPSLRSACQEGIWGHAESLVPLIQEAIQARTPSRPVDPHSLALFTQAVLQGGFILAKAAQSPEPAIRCLDELEAFLRSLFSLPAPTLNENPKP